MTMTQETTMAGRPQAPRVPQVVEITGTDWRSGWKKWEVAYRGALILIRQRSASAMYEAYCDRSGEPVCVPTLDRAVEMSVESVDRGWL